MYLLYALEKRVPVPAFISELLEHIEQFFGRTAHDHEVELWDYTVSRETADV